MSRSELGTSGRRQPVVDHFMDPFGCCAQRRPQKRSSRRFRSRSVDGCNERENRFEGCERRRDIWATTWRLCATRSLASKLQGERPPKGANRFQADIRGQEAALSRIGLGSQGRRQPVVNPFIDPFGCCAQRRPQRRSSRRCEGCERRRDIGAATWRLRATRSRASKLQGERPLKGASRFQADIRGKEAAMSRIGLGAQGRRQASLDHDVEPDGEGARRSCRA